MCYCILTKSGTVIAETNVQHVTRDDMVYAGTATQVENLNTDKNEQITDIKFLIQHGEGGLILEDDYAL